MELRLYDSLSRSLRPFEALDPPRVDLYACGQTVYDYAHVGNLRTYLFVDLLRRTLAFNGYVVRHVMNITDVGHLVSDADSGEDKMEKGSRRAGKSAWEIAEYFTADLLVDMQLQNILEPHILCRATDHIAQQIALIACIEDKGLTYRTSDGIYFDTSLLPDYGRMALLDVEGLQAGARVEMADKRNVTDFALWKFSPPDAQRQMEWDSPWGVGFPGWHIECTAMSAHYLGPFFDIHCGGEDHIMVHHPNEIAQAQACFGTTLANNWLHGYFLQIADEETGEGGRMGKSLGNFLRLKDLQERGYEPLAWRFLCLGAHYRSKLTFNWQSMAGAQTALNRLRAAVYGWGEAQAPDEAYVDRFRAQINDDLNLPRALAVTWDLAKSELPDAVKKATITVFDEVLGLDLAAWRPLEEAWPTAVEALVAERQKAREERRWSDADALRDEIQALGYDIEDTPQGAKLRPRR